MTPESIPQPTEGLHGGSPPHSGRVTDILGAAHNYFTRGWALTPVRGKAAFLPDWQRGGVGEEEVLRRAREGCGIGRLNGEPSGVVDVDLDCPKALRLAPAFLPPTGSRFGRPRKANSHWGYCPDPVPSSERFTDPDGTRLVEVLSTGTQTVLPPSPHPDGGVYSWDEDGEPARVPADDLLRAVRRLAAAALLARHWPPTGSREAAALALARVLLEAGWSEEAAAAFIRAVAEVAGDEEATKRARAARDTARRLAGGGSATGRATLRRILGEEATRRALEWLGVPAPLAVERPAVLLGAAEVLAAADGEGPDWLVDELLPVAGLSLNVARPKVGKSTFARALAVAVVQGRPFLGRATRQGAVLLISLEDRLRDVARHLRRLGLRPEDPLFVAAAKTDLRQLRAWVQEHAPVLVIVDTVSRLVRMRDVSEYGQVLEALEALLALARQTGAHLHLLHHAPKGSDGRDPVDAPLGSTALAGTVDVVIHLKRLSDGTRTITTVQRVGEDLPENVLALGADGSPELRGARREHQIAEAANAIVAFLEGQTEPIAREEILRGVEGRAEHKVAALEALLAEGQIARTGKGVKGDPHRYHIPFPRSHDSTGNGGTECEKSPKAASRLDEFRSHTPAPSEGGPGTESGVPGTESEPPWPISPTAFGPAEVLGDIEAAFGPVEILHEGPDLGPGPGWEKRRLRDRVLAAARAAGWRGAAGVPPGPASWVSWAGQADAVRLRAALAALEGGEENAQPFRRQPA